MQHIYLGHKERIVFDGGVMDKWKFSCKGIWDGAVSGPDSSWARLPCLSIPKSFGFWIGRRGDSAAIKREAAAIDHVFKNDVQGHTTSPLPPHPGSACLFVFQYPGSVPTFSQHNHCHDSWYFNNIKWAAYI